MKSSKRNCRIVALQIVYQQKKIGMVFYSEEYFLKKTLDIRAKNYIDSLVKIFNEKKKIIDRRIKDALIGWKQDRIASTLNTILQLAIAEHFLFPSLAPSIIFSEYLEICRDFAGEEAVKLCNGILSKIIISK